MSRNSKNISESICDNQTREIKLLLQITKTVSIDKYTLISSLKTLVKQHFKKIANEFNLYIKEFEISTLDNMNALRTFEYYKSNTLTIHPKNLNTETNFVSNDIFSEYENSRIDQNGHSETNRKYNDESNKITKDFLSQTKPNIRIKKKVDLSDNELSPSKEITTGKTSVNYQNISKKLPAGKPLTYSFSENNPEIPRNRSSFETYKERMPSNVRSMVISPLKFDEKLKSFNSPITQLNDEYLKSGYFNLDDDLFRIKEENENLILTNKILNKSNIDLKNQIKMVEEELEQGKENHLKLNDMQKVIQNQKEDQEKLQDYIEELINNIQNLKNSNLNLTSENRKLKTEIEMLNMNFENVDKTNYDLKVHLDGFDEINKMQENERRILSNQIGEKDKKINELNEKLKASFELTNNLKKNCKDYEEMMNGLKKTIEIMKNSHDKNDNEIIKLKTNFDETKVNLNKRIEENNELEKNKNALISEIDLLKNEIMFLNSQLNNKSKDLVTNNNNLKDVNSEVEKNKQKVENLNKILVERDKSNENMKNSVEVLNRTIQDLNEQISKLKSKLNEEQIERTKLQKVKDLYDYNTKDLRKQVEELCKLKENLNKQNIALEEDNIELRLRYDEVKIDKEKLINDNNSSLENIHSLQKQIAKEREISIKLESEISNLNFKIMDLNTQISQSKSAENSLKNDMDNLQSTVSSKEELIDKFLKSKDELNNEILNLKEKLKIIMIEKNKAIEDYETKNNELRFMESKLRRELEKLLTEIRQKDKIIEDLNRVIDELNQKIKDSNVKRDNDRVELENIIEEMKKSISEHKELQNKSLLEKEDLLNDIKYKNRVIDGLNKNVSELNENVTNLKKNYDELDGLNKANVEKIDEMRNLNDDLNRKNDNSSSIIESLMNNFKEVKQSNVELEMEINTLKNDSKRMKNTVEKLELDNKILIERNVKLEEKVKGLTENTKSVNILGNLLKKKKTSETGKSEDSPNKSKDNLNKFATLFTRNVKQAINEIENIDLNQEEIPVKTSDLNLKLAKVRGEKVDILEGSKILFSIFDNKRILRFDLENKMFKLIEFADFGNFEYNYIAQGSTFLNILDGLLIVTGDNHDLFYYYSHSKHTMNKLAKLTDNHIFGTLIYVEASNSVICLSGSRSKSVESYFNDDMLSNFLKRKIRKIPSPNKNKNSWMRLPDLNEERTNCPFIFLDTKYIYGFFGYDITNKRYLETIERLDLENLEKWEIINFKSDKNNSIFKKGHSIIKLTDTDLLLLGGYDGNSDSPCDNLCFFNMINSEYSTSDKRFPDVDTKKHYSFQKNSNSSPFIDINNKLHYAAIDEKNAIHIVEVKSLKYDLFIFFD